jgi:hypothetical protein
MWEPLAPDLPFFIAFAVNLLAIYSVAPTKKHWVGVKTILKYLQVP